MGDSRWKRYVKRLISWVMSAALVFALIVLLSAVTGGPALTAADVSSALLGSIAGLLGQAGSNLSRFGRWGAEHAASLGDLATWITGFFTFAAFYLALRIYLQGRNRELRAQASQVAAWAHLRARSSTAIPGPDDRWCTRNLRVSYTVLVANHSAAPIMGLEVSVEPYGEDVAKSANRYGKWYFENNVKVWLEEVWLSENEYRQVKRLGPWIFDPGAQASHNFDLGIDLEFCEAKIRFWDAQGVRWSKDVKTGVLEPQRERLGLVDGDTPVTYDERWGFGPQESATRSEA
jgi:hypothetical protein